VFPSVSLLLRGRSNVASAIGHPVDEISDTLSGRQLPRDGHGIVRQEGSPLSKISDIARATDEIAGDRSAFDSAWAGCYHSDKRVDRLELRLRLRFAKRPARALFHGGTRTRTDTRVPLRRIQNHLESPLPGDRINVSVFPSWRVISDCGLA